MARIQSPRPLAIARPTISSEGAIIGIGRVDEIYAGLARLGPSTPGYTDPRYPVEAAFRGSQPQTHCIHYKGEDMTFGKRECGAVEGATYNHEPPTPEIFARVEGIEAVCRSYGVPIAAAAFQFPLTHPNVVSVIPRVASRVQLEWNVARMTQAIPVSLWADLKTQGLLRPDAPVPTSRLSRPRVLRARRSIGRMIPRGAASTVNNWVETGENSDERHETPCGATSVTGGHPRGHSLSDRLHSRAD